MNALLSDLCSPDPLGAALAALILAFIGRAMVGGREPLRRLGWKVAGLGALLATLEQAAEGASDLRLLSCVMSGLMVGGLMIGPAWIMIVIGDWLSREFLMKPSQWLGRLRQKMASARDQRQRSRQAAEAAEQQAEESRRQQERRQEADERRRREEAERQRREAEAAKEAAELLRRRQQVARDAVASFHAKHRELLEAVYPQDLLDAVLRAEMPDGRSPEELWKIAQEKIRTLLTLLGERQRERRSERRQRGIVQLELKKLDDAIRLYRDRLDRLLALAGDLSAAAVEDERLGLYQRLCELEAQKGTLLLDLPADDSPGGSPESGSPECGSAESRTPESGTPEDGS